MGADGAIQGRALLEQNAFGWVAGEPKRLLAGAPPQERAMGGGLGFRPGAATLRV